MLSDHGKMLSALRDILGYAEGWVEQDVTGPEEKAEKADLIRAVANIRRIVERFPEAPRSRRPQ